MHLFDPFTLYEPILHYTQTTHVIYEPLSSHYTTKYTNVMIPKKRKRNKRPVANKKKYKASLTPQGSRNEKKTSCYWLLSRLKKLHIEEVVLERTFSSLPTLVHFEDGVFFSVPWCWTCALVLDTDSEPRSLPERESRADTNELFLDFDMEFLRLFPLSPPLRFLQDCEECERWGESPLRLRGAGLCLPAGAWWRMNMKWLCVCVCMIGYKSELWTNCIKVQF